MTENNTKPRMGRPPIYDKRKRPRELNHVRLSEAADDEVARVARAEGLSRQALVSQIVDLFLAQGPLGPSVYPPGWAEDLRRVREM